MRLRCESGVSETNAVAVMIPEVFALPSVQRPTPVSAEPSSAGNVPVIFAAGKLVKLAALIAGSAPLNFDEDTVDNLASATVPVNCPAGTLVKFAPLPVTSPVTLPLKLFAVTIPAITTPSALVVIVPTPAVCVILLTLISDAI